MSPEAQGPLSRRLALLALAGLAAPQAAQAAPADPLDHAALAALFGLAGKVAVVTNNGGSGYSEVIALLAQAGATVVSLDSTSANFDRAMTLEDMAGRPVSHIRCDISNAAEVRAAFAAVVGKHRRLDVLANCGGLYANSPLGELSDAQWDAMIALGLTANMLCMREAIRQMKAAGNGGAIVNVTTVGAVNPAGRGHSGYAAARAGVTMLGRTAALDYAADRIRVNTVLSGVIMGHVQLDESVRARLGGGGGPDPKRLPFGLGRMSDLAAAVLYLAAPSGKWITGQDFAVDGGFLVT
jgi:NAD(P)-dependent dehydrogenase (short-subunit alcohol dehydrogenase family)